MRTLGIDLSSDPKKTAAAVIEWTDEGARVAELLTQGVTDAQVLRLFGECDATGIDAPFGWPRPFVDFLSGHVVFDSEAVLPYDGPEGRSRLANRETDRFVRQFKMPLSVSADKIAYLAMRCAVLQFRIAERFGSQPRDGSGRLYEVYPAASLSSWGMLRQSYKGRVPESSAVLEKMVEALAQAVPWLSLTEHFEVLFRSHDLFDAVIASITARAAAVGATYRPTEDLVGLALVEGWIHVPRVPLEELAPAASFRSPEPS